MGAAETLGGNAFRGCTGLTEISLPNASSMGTYCFSGCSSLQSAEIGPVSQLPANAFSQCTALTKLTLCGSKISTLAGASTFTGTPVAAGTGLIFVPAELLAGYQAAARWAAYAPQLRAIEG